MSGNNKSSSHSRIEPSFFGSSSQRKKLDTTSDAAIPTENPYWHSPPPYLPMLPSTTESLPSAPPLIETHLSTANNSIYPPPGYNQQVSTITSPLVSYPHYGAVVDSSPPSNPINHNWPWRIIQPNLTNDNTIIPLPPPQQQQSCHNNGKGQKLYCLERLTRILFYFIGFFALLYFFVLPIFYTKNASCWNSTDRQEFTKQFEYDSHGLSIRVIGGRLSKGHIRLERMTDGEDKGLVRSIASISQRNAVSSSSKVTYNLINHTNGSTSLEIYLPHSSLSSCVSLDTIIYIPNEGKIQFLRIDVPNTYIEASDEHLLSEIDHLSLKSTNNAIRFNSSWKGKRFELETTNSPIEIDQSLVASDSIHISTTNGFIRFKKLIRATHLISVLTTNSNIDIEALIESRGELRAITTNGHVLIEAIIADYADIRSTNKQIKVNSTNVTSILNIQTTNSPLHFYMNQDHHTEVIAQTTNNEIHAYMTSDFEGLVEVKTSRSNKIKLIDPLGWTSINFVDKGHLMGSRYRPAAIEKMDSTKKGDLKVKTTNANANVFFFF
ncbi:uncharacterized protein BX663DRAFT_539239 [Cokeromyces recurvatus]|uniref:uncharacterized protein n=1 Tax=Cokeromyces recurvatus TaxID=90255 RepID=UPI00221F6E48|nr:uncharacterized protein BX663DRAFT_539239 [Cokeromyces recurvatus]KAI7907817.1 hypothetical protein BX663DRAFT_539239 [Cokeromyces recurvatus]